MTVIHRVAPLLGAASLALLVSCSGGDGDDEIVIPGETDPPEVQLRFPTGAALTDAGTVLVKGTAADASGVAAVTVNGVAAQSEDGFATWRAVVPLAWGPNTLTVAATDLRGNTDASAATGTVRREADWVYPGGLEADASHGRILVAESGSGSIVAVDESSRVRSVVSGPQRGGGPPLDGAYAVAVDPAGDRAWVAASGPVYGETSIVEVDLASGDRRIVASATVGTGPGLTPVALVYEPTSARLLVTDPLADAVVAVDPATGVRTIVSGAAQGTGPALDRPSGIDLLPSPGRAVVACTGSFSYTQILAVDLQTGDRQLLSDGGINSPISLSQGNFVWLATDAARNRVLAASEQLVIGVDLASGALELVSGTWFTGTAGGGAPLSFMSDIVWDPVRGRVLAMVNQAGALLDIDPVSGNREVVTSPRYGSGPGIRWANGFAADTGRSRVLLSESYLEPVGFTAYAGIVAIDIASGDRATLSSYSTGGGTVLANMFGIASDPARGRALVGAFTPSPSQTSLFSVDLETGQRAYFGGGGVFSTYFPVSLALDAGTDRLFSLDQGQKKVFEVDLAAGTHTEIVGSGAAFVRPLQIALDLAGARVFVTDVEDTNVNRGRIVTVDLTNGSRTVLPLTDLPNGPPVFHPRGILVEGGGTTLIVADGQQHRLVRVDPATGLRTVLSGPGVGSGYALRPLPSAAGPEPAYALAWNPWGEGILVLAEAVHLVLPETGDRFLLSR